ncbi:MAG: DMT family transporter [Candidatus Eisenbacteria bacterium]
MSIPHLGEIAALGTASCWTLTAIAFESAGRRIGSLVVNFLRLLIAAVFLSGFNAITRGHLFPDDASSHAWLWLALSGFAGFNFGDLCLFRAFVVLGSRLSVLVMSLVPPITAAIGYVFLGERLRPLDLAGMALTVLGFAWVVRSRRASPEEETHHHVQGVLLALGGAVGQAVGLVLSKHGMGDYAPFAAVQIRVYAGILGFAVIFSASRWWPRFWRGLRDSRAFGWTTMGAFFGPFLGVSLSLLAVQKTEAGVAATLMTLTPVFILLPARILRGDRITWRSVTGAALAVGGSALLFL